MAIGKLPRYKLLALLLSMVVPGCLPPDCANLVTNLNKATVKVQEVTLTDLFDIDPVTGHRRPPGPNRSPLRQTPPTRTLVCTEFAAMRRRDDVVPLFVNAKVERVDGNGESWQSAFNSIGAALKAFSDIRYREHSKNEKQKTVYIFVAAGSHSHTHETAALKELGQSIRGENAPIIDIDGLDPLFYQDVFILGEYDPKDDCLEKSINEQLNPVADRRTVLDGENKSNHVVHIASDAKNLTVNGFEIKNGKATEDTPREPHKKYGGGMLIRSGAENITLENIVITTSEAGDKGGCLAIVGNAKSIAMKNVHLENCKAENGGGGLFIGENAHTISADTLVIIGNHTTHANSVGGGMMLAGSAGVAGGPANINISALIENNRTIRKGGGAWIGERATKIIFNDSNITLNQADLMGGGLYFGSFAGGAPVLVPPPANMPPAQVTLNNVHVENNQLSGVTGNERGAGILLEGPSGDFAMINGSIRQNKGNVSGIGMAIVGEVNHVKISGVTVEANGTLPGGANQDGVGIYANSDGAGHPSRIEINGSHFIDNTNGQNGAGLFLSSVEFFSIKGCDFRNNVSTQKGGAIYYKSDSLVGGNDNEAKLTIENDGATESVFIGNQAAQGGALFTQDVFDLNIFGARFERNSAQLRGGALYSDFSNFRNARSAAHAHGAQILLGQTQPLTFLGNSSQGDGGAIYFGTTVDAGNVARSGVRILRANAQSVDFSRNISHQGNGGAIFVSFNRPGNASVLNLGALSKFHLNQANFNLMKGGAILASPAPQNVELFGVFSENSAYSGGGAILLAGHAIDEIKTGNDTRFTENISHQEGGGAVAVMEKVQSLIIDGGISRGNKAEIGRLVDAAGNSGRGGAFFLVKVRRVLTVNNHQATQNQSHFDGGFIFIRDLTPVLDVTIDSSSFSKNRANHGSGGALIAPRIQSLEITSTSFDENYANQDGGAVAIGAVVVAINIKNPKGTLAAFFQSVLQRVRNAAPNLAAENMPRATNNVAENSGGVFHFGRIENGGLKISNQIWLNNIARNSAGGALAINTVNDDVTIKSPLFYRNHASTHGGAIYIGTLNGNAFTLSQNDTLPIPGNPPAEYFFRHHERFTDVNESYPAAQRLLNNDLASLNGIDLAGTKRGMFLIEANQSFTQNGGAIYVNQASDALIENMSFANNSAARDGGTLYLREPSHKVTLQSSIIFGGEAANGAGIYVLGGGIGMLADSRKLVISNSSIQANKIPNAGLCDGAAGVYGDMLKTLVIEWSNFFDNVVDGVTQDISVPAKYCAAAVNIKRLDGIPPGGALSLDASYRLLEIKGNRVNRANPPGAVRDDARITGTIFVPADVLNLAHHTLYAPDTEPFENDRSNTETPRATNRIDTNVALPSNYLTVIEGRN